ncbi:MAG: FAD-dependent oxidoreductase [Micromonosporaceae bacterium]|nr:FAD-dependent oxidoreductase [Micromonosporaceae bacterium]
MVQHRAAHRHVRVPGGGPVRFVFDGREHIAEPGDTLAAALLRNGVRIVATSLYAGRPRGVFGIGAEEPNAYVHVDSGGGETMLRATQVEVYDGLRARSLAGKGDLGTEPDTARYDKTHAHCDVLVVGAGPAGLAAALAAGASGARVILADEQPALGGGLLGARALLDGAPAADWLAAAAARLAAMPEVRVLPRTTVTGYHDHNYLTAVERRADCLADPPPHMARQRLWHIRARQVVLAAGAHERPIAFADNDRPGVMLAGAAASYAWRHGVLPGRRAVVFGAHDGALVAARDLADAGVEVAALADVRDGSVVVGTEADADGVLTAALIAPLGADGRPAGAPERVGCDLLAVSGGWDPAVHLCSQSGGRLAWSDEVAAFVPATSAQQERSVGAARGTFDLAAALAEGSDAGAQAAEATGFQGSGAELPTVESVPMDRQSPADERPFGAGRALAGRPPAAFFCVEPADEAAAGRVFVDLQRDATLRDLRRAVGAGMTSSEHVKRYTTIGTAADQGRTSGVLAVGLLANVLGRSMTDVGTTTYRPPYTPMSFALLAGRDRGRLADPERITALHAWHEARGAPFEDVGQWKRPWYFPQPGETGQPQDTMEQAVLRECRAAREDVAAMDASTLGKIELQGADVGEFLDRIYTGVFSALKVGRCKYGVMCAADGMVLDDGTVSRLSEGRWLMTTTTGNAGVVLDWLEEWLQTEWPSLDVRCTSVTEQWATVALVGPRSREVLAGLAPDLDVSNESFRFMDFREAEVAGLPARVFRISFSGELAYEINTPSWYGLALWQAVMAAGVTPYGTETMHVLRAEKGFVIVGQETDGTVTPQDLGMGWAVSKKKPDFVGKRSHQRADTARAGRKQLVGLLPDDARTVLAEGAQLVTGPPPTPPTPTHGHVTSSYRSAALERPFALAMVIDGAARHGETLYAVDGDQVTPVTVVEPVRYDKEGARRDG